MFFKYLMLLSLSTALVLKMYKISQTVRNHRLLNTPTLQHLNHTTTLEPHYNTWTTNFTSNVCTLQHLNHTTTLAPQMLPQTCIGKYDAPLPCVYLCFCTWEERNLVSLTFSKPILKLYKIINWQFYKLKNCTAIYCELNQDVP